MRQLQEDMFIEQKRQPQIFEEQAAGMESFGLARVVERADHMRPRLDCVDLTNGGKSQHNVLF